MHSRTGIVRARIAALAGLALIAASASACVASPDEPAPDTEAEVQGGEASQALAPFGQSIQNRASGKCLDIPGGSTEPGAAVNQYTCHGGPAQQFAIEPVAGLTGVVRIRNTRSDLCVTPVGYAGSLTLRMPLQQKACSSVSANWTRDGAVALTGGTRSAFRWTYDSRFCIEVPGGATTDGLQLQASPCSGATKQSFEDRPADLQPPTTTISVYYRDASGNLVSQYVTSTPGPNNRSLTVTLAKNSEYTIFSSASDNVGLNEFTRGCGKTDILYDDDSAETSSPLMGVGLLPSHPKYTLDADTQSPITNPKVVRESIQYCALAVDTSQRRAATPMLVVVRE